MNFAHRFLVFASFALVAVGCKNSVEEEASIAGEQGQTTAITLVDGDSIQTDTAADGEVTITVIIAPGRPNAGTYSSTDENLLSYARDALKVFGKGGHKVWIRVTSDREIATIGWSRKL